MQFLPLNIHSTCRVCLREENDMFPLYGDTLSVDYSSQLTKCTNIKMSKSDGLPAALCETCANEISIAYNLIIKCKESDAKLKRILDQQNLRIHKKTDRKEINDSNQSTIKNVPEALQSDRSVSPLESTPKSFSSMKHRGEVLMRSASKKNKFKHKEKQRIKNLKKKFKLENSPVQCYVCSAIVDCLSTMKVHMKSHSVEERAESIGRMESATGHVKQSHTTMIKTFICDVCGRLFLRKKDVIVHLRRHTGETPYPCTFCPRSFSQQGTLTRHLRTHTGEKPYPCETCGRKFAARSMLKIHYLVHTNEKQFTCDVCGKAVKSKDTLAKHLTLHSNIKSNICEKCGMTFAAKGNLNLHMKKVHSDRAGRCAVCGKQFSNLPDHMRNHTGETPFRCDICGRSFTQKGSLSIHASKHERAGKFSCTIDNCPESFPMKCMLEFHILKYHTNQTPFACTECNRRFYRNSDLSRHKKLYHQNEKSVNE